MSKENKSSGGIGFTSLLVLLFIGLKLTHHIDWSWWWVFSPWLVSIACYVLLAVILAIIQAITE